MTDTVLQLGDFRFARFEVPESIPFGGEQRLVTHTLVGGKQVIDAMGAVTAPIEWSGIFTGPNAVARARTLDSMRKAGNALDLTWHELSYRVVIASLHCDFKRFYRVPYKITCTVIEDKTAPVRAALAPSIDDTIMNDAAEAVRLAQLIDAQNPVTATSSPAQLGPVMATLNAAIKTVDSFATAAQSAINAVLLPLAQVRTQVGILLTAANNTVQNVTTFGGVLPNTPVAQNANRLLNQVNAVTQTPYLVNLDRVLGRMQTNLISVETSGKQITVVNDNLMRIASGEYGDAMGWTAIAAANSLNDPQVAGLQNLVIPPYTNDTGGVLIP